MEVSLLSPPKKHLISLQKGDIILNVISNMLKNNITSHIDQNIEFNIDQEYFLKTFTEHTEIS